MKLGFQQSQKMTTSLNLTQQMELSIRILQMDNMELDEYISNVAMENPVVELDDPVDDPLAVTHQKKLEWLEQQAKYDRQNTAYYTADDEYRQTEVAAPAEMNLPDYLALQAGLIRMDEMRKAVLRVIRYIDQNGYLRADEAELAACCAPLGVETVVSAIQQMEPAGVGARSLAECLLLQLPEQAALERAIAKNHLELLGKRQYEQIARLLGVSVDEVRAARDHIRMLDPCPGSAYEMGEPPVYIIPDLLVVESDEGYQVVPHRLARSELRLNPGTLRLAKEAKDPATAQYLNKKIKQAQWVGKCIENRGQTVLLVARQIVQRQQDFFRAGPEQLHPLALGEVAAALGLHESTVSRAVRGKYLQCEQGIYPLRSFFVHGIKNGDDQSVCAETVKYKIRSLIRAEDPQKPLSDQQLAEILAGEGIELSRRTVAKYRGQMNIPTSGRRGAR